MCTWFHSRTHTQQLTCGAWHKAQGTDNTDHTLIYTPAFYMYIHMYINSCHLLKLGIGLVTQKQRLNVRPAAGFID